MTLTLGIALFFGALALFFWRREKKARLRCAALIQKNETETEKHVTLATRVVTAATAAHKDQASLHDEILRVAMQSVDALSAALFLADDNGRLSPASVAGLFPILEKTNDGDAATLRSRQIKTAFQAEISITGDAEKNPVLRAAAQRKLVLVRQGDGDDFAARSLIAAPIFYNENFLGILAVANPTVTSRAFNEADCAVTQFIARQTGAAFYLQQLRGFEETRKLLYADLSLASSIQQTLLPSPLAKHTGIDIAAHYQPMHQIGGDFYYAVDLPDGRFGTIILDVAGKGIQAALLMAICRTHLTYLIHHCDSPALLLRKLNAAMQNTLGNGRYITAICAVINPVTNTLTLARAGHERPLLYSPSKTDNDTRFQQIQSEGIAVGLVPPDVFNEALTEVTVTLEPDCILLFYTDGLTEARNATDAEYGIKNVKKSIRKNATENSATVTGAILADMREFCADTPPQDDLTVVVMKYGK